MNTFKVTCAKCNMVHLIEVGDSALCQCGAVISVRRDGAGWVTPWGGYIDWSRLRGFEAKQIYKPQPVGE